VCITARDDGSLVRWRVDLQRGDGGSTSGRTASRWDLTAISGGSGGGRRADCGRDWVGLQTFATARCVAGISHPLPPGWGSQRDRRRHL